MAAEKLGNRRCPLCSSKARVSISKNNLTVLTCAACHCQLFARSGLSDQLLRAHLLADTDPPAAPVPGPLPTDDTLPGDDIAAHEETAMTAPKKPAKPAARKPAAPATKPAKPAAKPPVEPPTIPDRSPARPKADPWAIY